MNKDKLKVGKCEITTRNPRGNLVVLEGKIVEVKDKASEVQIPKYKGNFSSHSFLSSSACKENCSEVNSLRHSLGKYITQNLAL